MELNGNYADGYVPPVEYRTLVTVDGSIYLRWQTDLLARSHRHVHQPGALTRLWADESSPSPFDGETVWCPEATASNFDSGHYLLINRPAAIASWLAKSEPADEIVLIIDPDCLFLSPIVEKPQPGAPIGHPYWILNPELLPAIARRQCTNVNGIDRVGIPVVIQRSDLAQVAPLWLEKTLAILDDPIARSSIGTLAEVWGYALACADLGFHHETRELQVVNLEDTLESPLLHYSLPIKASRFAGWGWSKQAYRPWTRIADPPPGVPQGTVTVVNAINSWAEDNPYSLE